MRDIEQSPPAEGPSIVAVYPNPVTEGDRGEFVTVALPSGSNLSAFALADEQETVSLAPPDRAETNATRSTFVAREAPEGRLTFSTDPGLTGWLRAGQVAGLSGGLQLANGGERLRLLHGGEVIDSVQYESAPDGEVYHPEKNRWRPLGATDRPVVTGGRGTVETFVLPDASNRAVEFLDSATERILLAGYTISSRRVVESLTAAVERGVEVVVLADGSPVGGMTGNMATALSTLDRRGAEVRVHAGERARYRYQHAKYAVVDDRALVTTENWKPAGTGGNGSRGWGVITDQSRVVEGLVETYRADTEWVDAVPWDSHDPSLVEERQSAGEYDRSFEPRSVAVEQTRLLVTPDNAGSNIRETIENADESLDIKQVSIGDRSFPFLRTVLDAAARGVEVRILLSSAWYVAEDNRRLATWLRDQARAADLPLSVRLADPGNAFEKIHAKGMIVDGDQTLLGSINWNENSVENNREVAVLLESEPAARYFGEVFEADWQGHETGERGGETLHLGLGLAVLAGAVAAVLGLKRIRFD
jgi:phosphatidylserine/phosphatidylglycerophosphate/cardiolipin synthase-like enzyme